MLNMILPSFSKEKMPSRTSDIHLNSFFPTVNYSVSWYLLDNFLPSTWRSCRNIVNLKKKSSVIIKGANFVYTTNLNVERTKMNKIISVEELILSESDDQDYHIGLLMANN